jgi:aspartate aminotransferase
MTANARLAHRIQRIRPSPTVSITARAAALREAGRDIIALSAGEPDFDTPSHIKDAAVDAIRRGETKYTAVDGTRALKEAVAEKFGRENGLEYATDQIVVSNGAKQSCYNACQALLQEGDEVIVPAPYWVSYPDMARLADAEPVIVHTRPEHGFRMTPEQLHAAITPQTRLLILNSPCNPTGAVYTREDWHALGEVLRDHPRVFVITDDIYEHIYWGPEPFSTIAEACPHLYERTLTVNGVSKAYAMTGWRIGYAAGPAWLAEAMASLQSQSTTNPCAISQAAACAALTGEQSCVTEMCLAFKQRHDLVVDALGRLRGFECVAGTGAFYAFPKVEQAIGLAGVDDDVAFCERVLEQTGVALVPGSAFGAPGHLRISFACGEATLQEAFGRIAAFTGG